MTVLQLAWPGDTVIVTYLGDTIVTIIVIMLEHHGASHFTLSYCNSNNHNSLTISNLFWLGIKATENMTQPQLNILADLRS